MQRPRARRDGAGARRRSRRPVLPARARAVRGGLRPDFAGEVTGLVGGGAFVRFGEPGGPRRTRVPAVRRIPGRLVGAQRGRARSCSATRAGTIRIGTRSTCASSASRPRADAWSDPVNPARNLQMPRRHMGRSGSCAASGPAPVLVLLAVPSAARAAVREAVPSGGATSGPCDAAAPCTLRRSRSRRGGRRHRPPGIRDVRRRQRTLRRHRRRPRRSRPRRSRRPRCCSGAARRTGAP